MADDKTAYEETFGGTFVRAFGRSATQTHLFQRRVSGTAARKEHVHRSLAFLLQLCPTILPFGAQRLPLERSPCAGGMVLRVF